MVAGGVQQARGRAVVGERGWPGVEARSKLALQSAESLLMKRLHELPGKCKRLPSATHVSYVSRRAPLALKWTGRRLLNSFRNSFVVLCVCEAVRFARHESMRLCYMGKRPRLGWPMLFLWGTVKATRCARAPWTLDFVPENHVWNWNISTRSVGMRAVAFVHGQVASWFC